MTASRSFRRFRRALAPAVLAGGIVGSGFAITAGPAGATACGTSTTSSCTATGTLTLSAGNLTATFPSALGWSGSVASGSTLNLVDSTTADQTYQVSDLSGSGAGWHTTVSATTFTTGGGSPHTLADTGTFSTNGSTSSITANTKPTATCATTCTLPTNTTSYPVAITTAASAPVAVTIYDTSAATGLGVVNIGTVGWWLNVPPTAFTGTYTSTVTLSIVAAP